VTPELVLIAGPLPGPSVRRPVARRLEGLGWAASVPPAPGVPPRSPDDVLSHLLGGRR
jgi:hypothetical protein